MTRLPVQQTASDTRGQADAMLRGSSSSLSRSTSKNSGRNSRSRSGARSRVAARREDSSREPLAAARAEDTIHRAQPLVFRSFTALLQARAVASRQILRTIYLPSEKADTLLMTVESLQKQLTEVKKLEAGRNAALIEDSRSVMRGKGKGSRRSRAD